MTELTPEKLAEIERTLRYRHYANLKLTNEEIAEREAIVAERDRLNKARFANIEKAKNAN